MPTVYLSAQTSIFHHHCHRYHHFFGGTPPGFPLHAHVLCLSRAEDGEPPRLRSLGLSRDPTQVFVEITSREW